MSLFAISLLFFIYFWAQPRRLARMIPITVCFRADPVQQRQVRRAGRLAYRTHSAAGDHLRLEMPTLLLRHFREVVGLQTHIEQADTHGALDALVRLRGTRPRSPEGP